MKRAEELQRLIRSQERIITLAKKNNDPQDVIDFEENQLVHLSNLLIKHQEYMYILEQRKSLKK